MPLPAELLRAIASPNGGRLALVIGAGCSVEAPTSIPVSRVCSAEIHRQLVADGILQDGECEDPSDLSLLADAVFERLGSQRVLVERLRDQYGFKLAPANEGYSIAAALLCEGAITSIVTLNFDLALSTALSELGAHGIVGIVERPEDLQFQKNINVYYLHRNVNAADPDLWVLRSAAMATEWKDHWENIIANSVLATPVVLFAGLGTPLKVLIESAKRLKAALPDGTTTFLAGPGNPMDSQFFAELNLDVAHYLQLGWGALMRSLSDRLSVEQMAHLSQAVTRKINEDGMTPEAVQPTLDRFRDIGIVTFGRLRAHWLLHDKPYRPINTDDFGLIADLVLAIGYLERVSGATASVRREGIVDFSRNARIVASFQIASGRGHRGRAAIEADVNQRRTRFPYDFPPSAVLIAGTSDTWDTPLPSAPDDIISGDMNEPDLISGTTRLSMIHVNQLRHTPQLVGEVVP
jgi:hypothetical protein